MSIGDSEDLDDLGFGTEHLDDLTLRLCKTLLARGARLGYGGVLRPDRESNDKQHSFLEVLVDIVAEEATRDPNSPPLVNYQPWPWFRQRDMATTARLIGVTKFVDVSPPGPEVADESDAFLWTMASALTAMRRLMTDGSPEGTPPLAASVARIALGGKRRGWAGILPGVAEEVLYALEADRPVYLLGGYGGCTMAIVDYILGDGDDLPDELTLAGNEPSEKLAKIMRHAPVGYVEDAFGRLAQALAEARADRARLNNGLTPQENDTLMRSENARLMGLLLSKGLTAVGV